MTGAEPDSILTGLYSVSGIQLVGGRWRGKVAKKKTIKKTARKKVGKKGATVKKAAAARTSRKKVSVKKGAKSAVAKASAKKKASAKRPSAAKRAKKKVVKSVKKKATAAKTVPSRKVAKTTARPKAATKPAADTQDPIQFPEERALPKTRLTPKQLAEFKQLLVAKRREMVGDVRELTRGATNQKSESGGDHSTMPIHMADIGSDTWEQEFTLGLIANERDRIREIDDALKRIADRTYGVCVSTRKPITCARLRAKPWAKYCIEYAIAREEGRAF